MNPENSAMGQFEEYGLQHVKGTGFSPYINPATPTWALAPEGMLLQSDPLPRILRTCEPND